MSEAELEAEIEAAQAEGRAARAGRRLCQYGRLGPDVAGCTIR